ADALERFAVGALVFHGPVLCAGRVDSGLLGVRWRLLGRKSFGTIRGTMNLFYTWGSVLGPVIAGAVYDRTHSYATVLTGMTVLLMIAALFTATLINPWAITQQRLREIPVNA